MEDYVTLSLRPSYYLFWHKGMKLRNTMRASEVTMYPIIKIQQRSKVDTVRLTYLGTYLST